MKIVSKLLADILLIELDTTIVVGGFESCRSNRELSQFGITTKFVQDNYSRSRKSVLRGLHYQIQRPQGKLVQVVSGAVFDVVVDLRKSFNSFGQSAGFDLSGENNLIAWIPPGYAHGFFVTADHADVLYSVTDYRFAEFERTLLWSDPTLGIDWPIEDGSPLLSEKDDAGQPFSAIEVYD